MGQAVWNGESKAERSDRGGTRAGVRLRRCVGWDERMRGFAIMDGVGLAMPLPFRWVIHTRRDEPLGISISISITCGYANSNDSKYK